MVPRGLFCKNIESHGVGCLGVQPAGLHPCVTDVPPSHRSGKMLCSRPLGCLEECKLRIGINVTHTARMILFLGVVATYLCTWSCPLLSFFQQWQAQWDSLAECI